jgi:hypothetical protein
MTTKVDTHRQIRPDWHELKTPAGNFYGYSEAEVRWKASRHTDPIADIAREEQERALREGRLQRGIR